MLLGTLALRRGLHPHRKDQAMRLRTNGFSVMLSRAAAGDRTDLDDSAFSSSDSGWKAGPQKPQIRRLLHTALQSREYICIAWGPGLSCEKPRCIITGLRFAGTGKGKIHEGRKHKALNLDLM